MTLRWVVLLMVFAVPLLALIALWVGLPADSTLNVVACVLALVAFLLWLLGGRSATTLPDDEMAHEVKNRTAATLLVIENAAFVGVLLVALLTDFGEEATLKLVYALVLLSIWVYGIAVAWTWRSLGK